LTELAQDGAVRRAVIIVVIRDIIEKISNVSPESSVTFDLMVSKPLMMTVACDTG